MSTRKSLDEIIGENLHYYRNHFHLTQAEVAEKLNVSISHIANIERKESSASLSLIEKILDLFQLSPNDLLLEKEISSNLSDSQILQLHICQKIEVFKAEILNEIKEFEYQNSDKSIYSSTPRARPAKREIADNKKN